MPLTDRVLHSRRFWDVTNTLSKYFYPFAARRLRGNDVVFINFGYEEDPPMAVPLAAADEAKRAFIQLYHSTATQTDISGKRVLEVGCGFGGGASYVMRTLHPASYTGLDLNPAGIDFCRKWHKVPGLDFVQGDAQNLPFPDQSFDAVINIESSLHYPDFPRFLTEVARVLRPGGHFLYADIQPYAGVEAWEAMLADFPLRMLSQREINAEVLRGMEKGSQYWLDLFDRHVPRFLHRFARKFAPLPGTTVYRDLENGTTSYRMYSFVKD